MSQKFCALGAVAAAGLVSSLTSFASADVVLSFGYTDLAGSYSAGKFGAIADAESTGDVTRLVSPTGQADFATGFVTGADSSNFELSLDVTSILSSTAHGKGSFTITDADGDLITGNIEGDFSTPGFGITFFNGLLKDVTLTDTGAADGTFDGSVSGTAFGIDLSPITMPLDGALVQLFINTGSTGFFGGDFSGVSTQVSGEIVPAPATLALLGAGLLSAGRRRR